MNGKPFLIALAVIVIVAVALSAINPNIEFMYGLEIDVLQDINDAMVVHRRAVLGTN